MKWHEVCEHYPNQIVLVEALITTSVNHIRTIEEMSILSNFSDNMAAWNEYKRLHKSNPDKELYILHTSKENAEVIEQFFVGLRGRK
jgi:hypothetical protein